MNKVENGTMVYTENRNNDQHLSTQRTPSDSHDNF